MRVVQGFYSEDEMCPLTVVMECNHLCMMMRGVEKQNSEMVTSAVLGSFREDERVRQEFLSLVG